MALKIMKNNIHKQESLDNKYCSCSNFCELNTSIESKEAVNKNKNKII